MISATARISAVEDPDQMLYCDKEVDALIDQQSSEPDPEKQSALGLGDRAAPRARRLAADHLVHRRHGLLVAACQGRQPGRQQRFQQLAI
jgi:hypothetical protein